MQLSAVYSLFNPKRPLDASLGVTIEGNAESLHKLAKKLHNVRDTQTIELAIPTKKSIYSYDGYFERLKFAKNDTKQLKIFNNDDGMLFITGNEMVFENLIFYIDQTAKEAERTHITHRRIKYHRGVRWIAPDSAPLIIMGQFSGEDEQ